MTRPKAKKKENLNESSEEKRAARVPGGRTAQGEAGGNGQPGMVRAFPEKRQEVHFGAIRAGGRDGEGRGDLRLDLVID